MNIRAFRAVRPHPDHVEAVASVPYDVVNRQEAAELAAGNPYSMLHVVRAEIDLPDSVDPYDSSVYEKAAENFQSLQDQGVLIRDETPCLYAYRQIMGDHSQTGIMALCHVTDYERDVIKKHEKTRPAKEDDRTTLTDRLSANPGPVFLTYQGREEIDRLVAEAESGQPLYDFTAQDGVRHTVWKMEAPEALVHSLEKIPVAYVADGHHRSASAARVGRLRREANPNHSGEEDYNWFLCVLFPADQLKILAYNRFVYDTNGLDEGAFLDKVKSVFRLREGAEPVPPNGGEAAMYFQGKWYGLGWDPVDPGDPVAALDVSVLQDRLLAPVLGIDDPRTSERIEFIGGIRGTGELEKRVTDLPGSVAFSLYPVSVKELMAIADNHQIMAPKSTWFEPKLRSGLAIHTF